MNTKHTPGPWVIESRTNKGAGFSIIAKEAHFSCAGVAHYIGEADARLIAAAPDLLEALKRMREKYGEYACEICEIADSAIAKATGEKN